MRRFVVSVNDSATNLFGQPVFVPAVGQALRSFTDEINRADSELGKHPEDYALYSIGEFDDETGLLSPVVPVLLLRGKDAKIK